MIPKVSVVMPVYNGQRYLRQAIDSVIMQTMNDWELVVVNDGSTDDSSAILHEYQDPRIRIIHQRNCGEAGARNTGLNNSRGKYISFLDADDEYLENALTVMVNHLDKQTGIDVIFTDGYFIDENNRKLGTLTEIRPGIYTGNILEQLVISNSVITVPACTMLRRSILESSHIQFDTDLGYGTDWDFWTRLSRFFQFGYVNVKTCLYRVHTSNMTHAQGASKKKNDLTRVRNKMMHSEWFSNISIRTRKFFFHILLNDLLCGQPAGQKDTLESLPVTCLPASDQAELWRQVGIQYLQDSSDPDNALAFLEKAYKLWPQAKKTEVIYKMTKFNKNIAKFTVITWQAIISVARFFRSFGKQKVKPVPKQLNS